MIHPFRLPARIGSQIALLVVGVIGLLYLVLSVTLVWQAPRGRPGPPAYESVATIAKLVAQTPPQLRQMVVETANAADRRFRFTLSGTDPAPSPSKPHPFAAEGMAQRLGPGFVVQPNPMPEGDRPPQGYAIRLPDGTGLDVAIAAGGMGTPPPRPVSILVVATIIVLGLNIGALTLWASRGITAPLARFASAAEEFSIDRDPAPLPEEGPLEVRTAARALNRLRDRIHALFADRTRMLAAISHDLRTPITRMRLRVEFIEDHVLRAQFTRDLEHMGTMVQGALSYLRDVDRRQQRSAVDLSSLLQTIADEFSDIGKATRYEGPRRLVATGDAQQLERAVTNLVENAVRHGTQVIIRLRDETDALLIEVADDGPGIPQADRLRLLEPFMRGDEARGRIDSEGFGLGLAITRSIAAAHDGELTLHDNQPRGLLARISLPRQAAAAPEGA
ncbi:ATP-binding protein [Bosea sp. BIWAKO-01]|uniref:ATP-binding protein n=1 Tax=Bosea sp. BIWAKO-01 TaxID=506668 RepID=UPI000853D432|nr:ATP-binding protein [Bosea sp. BIWAKO-01]GAU86033.1 sensor histidine kinase [Bosea sp. BIWAKO-01]